MLVKDSDSSEESTLRVPNFENVTTNVSNEKECESDYGDTSNTNLNSLTQTRESCDNNDKTYEDSIVPTGYQLLPENFFQYKGIPPPLVLTSWLELLKSEDDSGEDSVPLASLRKKLKKKRRLKNSNPGEKLKKEKKATSEYFPIKRKRGRPKKQSAENLPTAVDNDFENEEKESIWNDGDDDLPKSDDHKSVEVEVNTVNNNAVVYNSTEHDYFKPLESSNVEKVVENKNVVKEKWKYEVQGVKIGNSKLSFLCLECGKSFSAASTLKCHQRIHNGTLLICPECHKGFVSKYLLKCHMRIHNGDLFMCHKCGRGFTTAELLKVHSRAHTGDRPFVCNVCGKSFPTSSNMLQHKQIHNSEKKYLCSQCGSSFVQKRCLDYHMLTHAEKKNICNVCGKLWARKSDLIEHMRVHTGVKPYSCSICPQKFSQASSLKRHQLVHMNIKPISCETCNKMFKCQEYYKRHVRKHEKEEYLLNDA